LTTNDLLGLTQHEVEVGFQPDLDDMITNVVARPHPNGNGWFIRGDTTQEPDLVAKFSRRMYRGSQGIIAQHIRLDVEPYFQDSRYAKALLKASFALYQRIGVVFVEMDAVQAGVVVWSRLGWSTHGPGIGIVQEEIERTYYALHGERPPASFSCLQFGPDIFDLEDSDGNRIGEETLQRLGRSSEEISMRLHLSHARATAVLRKRDIV
jgi:hypothetical protein